MDNNYVFSSDELINVLALSPVATAIHTSQDLTIQMANDAMLSIWGRDKSVIGKSLEVALPELKGQPFLQLMQNVLKTGITHRDTDTAADLVVNGKLQTFYFDFIYQAVKNAAGETYCVLHTATDVTARYLSTQAALKAQRAEAALQREQALNEELAATNEELKATQESLQQLNTQLESRVAERTRALAESEANFRRMILQAPVAIGLFKGRDMVLDTINKEFLKLWDRDKSIIGKPLLEALPELTDQPYPGIMQHVYETGNVYYGDAAGVMLNRNGVVSEGHYNFANHPFKNADGQIEGVIVVANEVTEQVIASNKVRQSEQRLHNMVMNTPISIAILAGPEMVIEIANQSMYDIWSRTPEQTIGKKLLDVFPELIDQPFPKMLNDVFATGKPIAIPEIEVDIDKPDGLARYWVNFSYDPLFDDDGKVEAIMATVVNITDVVQARKELEENEAELQTLNEEITASNEELAATNEELYATNEELGEVQLNLQKMIRELEVSEGKFKQAVNEAPVAMAVFAGRDLIIELANNRVLDFWGKSSAIIGKPLAEAIPELEDQPFLQLMDNVFTTGELYEGKEALTHMMHNGEMHEGYFNFIYQPVKNDDGQVTSIMMVATDVTEQVAARKALEKAEETTRFAIEAANVGTWYLDTNTHEFVVSARLKEQFGYHPDEEVTYEMVAAAIPEDYRQLVLNAVRNAIATGQDYVMEHPVLGHHDQKNRWMRAIGRTYRDAAGNVTHFSGLIIDITEQKHDEMRKNDFIGMVSHELKTPLTSLSAYAQMLYNKARSNNDTFTAGALEKVNTQVRKMSTMINGFLNVSRLESGKIFLNKQNFDLDALIKEVIDDTQLTILSHRFTFKPCEIIDVHADRDKIGSVLSNLFSNAVKYSPRGKSIEVECNLQDGMAIISVKDEGMGIKPGDLDKIFDRYYRVESAHTQTVSGFGIGLYLCAEIVQRHDGKIWAESEKGQGSTFYFSLPVN